MSAQLATVQAVPAKQVPKNIAHIGRLANASVTEVLARYYSDESTVDIAASFGVTRQALNHFLLRHAEDDWKEAQVARAISRKEKAEDDLENAKDAFALAGARERLKAAQWDLERVCRRIYGDKLQVEHVSQPILNINIVAGSQHAAVLPAIPGELYTSPDDKP